MQKTKRVQWMRRLLIGVLSVIFVFSAGMVIRDLYVPAREQAANEALVQRVEKQASNDDTLGESQGEKAPQSRDYRSLHQENPDLAGWLTIGGTKVDYPVMYTPDAPEYYLRRAFDGSDALCGSLFIGEGYVPNGSNVLIYGHNMNDDTMFGTLLKYADEAYAREHSEITYDVIAPDGSHERQIYEVMGAFYSNLDEVATEGAFCYYQWPSLAHPQDFQVYTEQVMQASLYNLGVTASYGTRLLTLSTCSNHGENGRFVVVARQKICE